jgi:hypothetical protein
VIEVEGIGECAEESVAVSDVCLVVDHFGVEDVVQGFGA